MAISGGMSKGVSYLTGPEHTPPSPPRKIWLFRPQIIMQSDAFRGYFLAFSLSTKKMKTTTKCIDTSISGVLHYMKENAASLSEKSSTTFQRA